MGVFVRIDVRDRNACGLNLSNLRGCFDSDLGGIHSTCEGAGGKGFQPITKAERVGERRKSRWIENGLAVDQHNMTADAQFWGGFRQFDGFGERRTLRHQRGRSYNPADVAFHDGPIHPGGESEIVRIHDEPPHAASLAGQKIVTAERAGHDGESLT